MTQRSKQRDAGFESGSKKRTIADRYELDECLGVGGFGEVWRANDRKFGRTVAVKVLREDLVRNPDWRARRNDALAAKLVSPHIAHIYDLIEEADCCALIMEFVPGLSLSERLRTSGPLTGDETRLVALAVAEALDVAHRARIVHRDIKPGNIMLGDSHKLDEGHIKVVDWGLALGVPHWGSDEPSGKTHEANPISTGPFRFAGTAEYMAPEQIEGRVDRQSDIWAYGCVLYECLTAQRAFSGRGPELIRKVCCADVDYSLLPPDLPHSLRLLIEMCLQPEPRKRLRDIADAFALMETRARPASEALRPLRDLLPPEPVGGVPRQALVDEVAALVAKSPLTALSGPVGCGKSWVALKVARSALAAAQAGKPWFAGGVALVDLRDASDVSEVPRRLAALVAEFEGAAPKAVDIDWVRGQLMRRAASELLLVLDDADGVMNELPTVLNKLRVPGLHVLVTARRSPSQAGWSVRAVEPLECPPEQGMPSERSLLAYDAVKLFVERATASWRQFRLDATNANAVAAICRRLGGLPRAIELVASRIRFMTPQEILDRLSQLVQPLVSAPAQQTMSRTVEWSVASASPDERLLLERLSVFEGSWTLASVEAVCCDDRLPASLLHDLLNGLIDQALVQPEAALGRPRYRVFEFVRDLCRRRIDAAERRDEMATLRRRHLRRFADLVAAVEAPARGLERIDLAHEHGDCRAAIRFGLTDPSALESAVDMAVDMQDYWFARGLYADGIELLTPLLAAWGERGDVRQVRLRAARAKLVWLRDPRSACDEYRTALATQRRIVAKADDASRPRELTRLAAVLHNVGLTAQQTFEFADARAALAEARALYASLKSEAGEANTQLTTAVLDYYEGQFDDSQANLTAAAPVFHRAEDAVRVAVVYLLFGRIALQRDDAVLALQWCRNSLAMRLRTNQPEGIAESLRFGGELAAHQRQYRCAAVLFAAAERRRRALGIDVPAVEVAAYEASLQHVRAAMTQKDFDEAWSEGAEMSDAEVEQFVQREPLAR